MTIGSSVHAFIWSGEGERLGFPARLNHPLYGDMCGGECYQLSSPNEYAEALGDEPQRCSDMSINDILKTPNPQAFEDLWMDDVVRFAKSDPKQTSNQKGEK